MEKFSGFINYIYYNSEIIYFTGIQALFGQVKNRIGIGKHSVTVLEQLELLEHCQQVNSGISREISTLIVVDRNLDYASALLSPLTYEALLNEVFKNTCGTIGKFILCYLLNIINQLKSMIRMIFEFNFENYILSFFIFFLSLPSLVFIFDFFFQT